MFIQEDQGIGTDRSSDLTTVVDHPALEGKLQRVYKHAISAPALSDEEPKEKVREPVGSLSLLAYCFTSRQPMRTASCVVLARSALAICSLRSLQRDRALA